MRVTPSRIAGAIALSAVLICTGPAPRAQSSHAPIGTPRRKLQRASCSVGRSLHVRCSVGVESEKLPSTTAQFMKRSARKPRSVLMNAGLKMSLAYVDSKPVNFNCPKCGTTIRANAAFCPNCGRKIIR